MLKIDSATKKEYFSIPMKKRLTFLRNFFNIVPNWPKYSEISSVPAMRTRSQNKRGANYSQKTASKVDYYEAAKTSTTKAVKVKTSEVSNNKTKNDNSTKIASLKTLESRNETAKVLSSEADKKESAEFINIGCREADATLKNRTRPIRTRQSMKNDENKYNPYSRKYNGNVTTASKGNANGRGRLRHRD